MQTNENALIAEKTLAYFPRVMKKQGDGAYLVTSVEYQRTGPMGAKLVKIREFEKVVKFKPIGAKEAQKVSLRKSGNIDSIVLFDETADPATKPMALIGLVRRLKHLSKLEIV